MKPKKVYYESYLTGDDMHPVVTEQYFVETKSDTLKGFLQLFYRYNPKATRGLYLASGSVSNGVKEIRIRQKGVDLTAAFFRL